jgi:hypothetical protein
LEDETTVDPALKSTTPPLPMGTSIGYCQMWREYFDSPFVLNNRWTLYGNPQPQWIESAFGRAGLFDNNGPSPTKNYAVSQKRVGKGKGYSIESDVILKIENPGGSCICPGIAVSLEEDPVFYEEIGIPTSISFRIVYAGSNATWFDEKYRNHTWLSMEFISEDQTVVSSGLMPGDQYSNNWHKLKIEVTGSRYVKFYCDNNLIWAPFTRINEVAASDRKVVLGYTSDGDPESRAGEAYHDWVKVITIVPEEF